MREHDELMSALEAWSVADWTASPEERDLLIAYRAFKEAEPPLVLEAVDKDPGGMFYINWNGKSYRLPEGE